MSLEGSRNYKRIDAHHDLQEAARELRTLGAPLIQVGDALKALGQALKRLNHAAERAKPTRHEWSDGKGPHVKVSRDGLPRSVTTRAARLATQVEALAQEVKALPITPEQKAQARVERAKRREGERAKGPKRQKGKGAK